jgi:hypothetical protein
MPKSSSPCGSTSVCCASQMRPSSLLTVVMRGLRACGCDDDLFVLGDVRCQLPPPVSRRSSRLRRATPLWPRRNRAWRARPSRAVQLGADAGRKGARIRRRIARPLRGGYGCRCLGLRRSHLFPLFEQARVHGAHHATQAGDELFDGFAAEAHRHRLVERAEGLGQIAQKHALEALQAEVTNVVVEAAEAFEDFSRDRLSARCCPRRSTDASP